MDEKEVTIGTVLAHVQSLGQRMDKEFKEVKDQMATMNRNLSFQIAAIDKRLDDVEVEFLPKRVDRIEKHLGLPPIKEKAIAA